MASCGGFKNLDDFFMCVALVASKRGCVEGGAGACIVDDSLGRSIVGIGYTPQTATDAAISAMLFRNGASIMPRQTTHLYITKKPDNPEAAQIISQMNVTKVVSLERVDSDQVLDIFEAKEPEIYSKMFRSHQSVSEIIVNQVLKPYAGVISWKEYFMAIALLNSNRNDPHRGSQFGSCLINREGKLLSGGFSNNGCCSSAQMALLLRSDEIAKRRCRYYCTEVPCLECATLVLECGVRRIIALAPCSSSGRKEAAQQKAQKLELEVRNKISTRRPRRKTIRLLRMTPFLCLLQSKLQVPDEIKVTCVGKHDSSDSEQSSKTSTSSNKDSTALESSSAGSDNNE